MKRLMLYLILFFAGFSALYSQYLAKWTSMVNCNDSMTIVSKNSMSNDWCAHALTRNLLSPGKEGWIRYRVSQTGKTKLFGLTNGINECDSAIDFGYFLDSNGNLMVMESGILDTVGTYSLNDVLRIDITVDSVFFYQGDTKIYSLLNWNASEIKGCISFYSPDNFFDGVEVSFTVPIVDTLQIVTDANVNSSYPATNYGSSTAITASYTRLVKPAGATTIYRGLMFFSTDSIPNNSNILSAKLTLNRISGSVQYGFWLYAITSSWNESTVTYSSQPSYSSTDIYVINSNLPNTDPLYVFDIKGIVQKWCDGVFENHGLLLKKVSESGFISGSLSFLSSDGTPEENRPQVIITYLPAFDYIIPEKQPGSRTYDCSLNRLCLIYDEKYNVADANVLEYRIYNDEMTLVAGVNQSSGVLVSGSPVESVHEGKNKYELDLSGLSLTVGEYYLFEITTVKNEKLYIRFKLV